MTTIRMADLWRRLGRLLLVWTVVTTLGGAMTYGLFLGLSPAGLPAERWVIGLRLALAGVFGGAAAGSLQSWSLSGLWDAEGWVLATTGGWLLSLPLAVGLSVWVAPRIGDLPDGSRLAVGLGSAAFAGALGSIFQWRIIRRRLRYAGWWPVANAIGWLMAWLLVLSVGLFLGEGAPLPAAIDRLGHGLVLGGTAGFVIGAEQGIALIGLIAQKAWER